LALFPRKGTDLFGQNCCKIFFRRKNAAGIGVEPRGPLPGHPDAKMITMKLKKKRTDSPQKWENELGQRNRVTPMELARPMPTRGGPGKRKENQPSC